MSIFDGWFWRDAIERATKTAAQAATAAIGQDALGFDVFGADVGNVVGFALGGFVLSILSSLGSKNSGLPGTASLVD